MIPYTEMHYYIKQSITTYEKDIISCENEKIVISQFNSK